MRCGRKNDVGFRQRVFPPGPFRGQSGAGDTHRATLGFRSDSERGALAEWLRSGLQSRLHRFDSGRRLSTKPLLTLLVCAVWAGILIIWRAPGAGRDRQIFGKRGTVPVPRDKNSVTRENRAVRGVDELLPELAKLLR